MTILRIRPLVTAVFAGALLLVTAGCGTFSAAGREQYQQSQGDPQAGASASTSAAPVVVPYDIRPLLHPAKKYLGVAADGAPASLNAVDAFAAKASKKPNLIEFYSAWGDQYESTLVSNAWSYGALPFIAWEPFKKSLSDIASGKEDAYIRTYASSVKQLNLPVAISFGHEMNGNWYPWGTKTTTAKEFVAAFRHLHDVFADVGATQVIWVWSPNVINPAATVKLKPYWPGDDYVDWVGVVGYYSNTGPSTFKTLYKPTMDQIRGFTGKPFIIAETASQAGVRKPADMTDLFKGVAQNDDVLGFVWFNFNKETDWRITSGPASAKTFRQQAQSPLFGFDVKKP